ALANSVGDPLIAVVATSAAGEILRLSVVAAFADIFLTSTFAFAERFRSASDGGIVTAMSYFTTCHVAVGRVSCALTLSVPCALTLTEQRKRAARINSFCINCVATVKSCR